jgi:hypothetical protein
MNKEYAIFEKEYYHLKEQKWVKELVFYAASVVCDNFSEKWQLKGIKGKRKELNLLGIREVSFPIQYPFIIDNLVINKTDFFKDKGEYKNDN